LAALRSAGPSKLGPYTNGMTDLELLPTLRAGLGARGMPVFRLQ
jgi:hypothetical protein